MNAYFWSLVAMNTFQYLCMLVKEQQKPAFNKEGKSER